jgi:hypothetical protein
MYWYNPKIQASERSPAPSTDEQAIDMLSGAANSWVSTASCVTQGWRSSKRWSWWATSFG